MYVCPLSDEENILLGKIFSEIARTDYFMMSVIAQLTRISLTNAEILLGRAMFSVRLSALGKLSQTISIRPELKDEIGQFCGTANRLVGKRNHLAHGIWGLYTNDEAIKPVPACYYPDNKKGLISSSELSAILEEARNLSKLISSIFNSISGLSFQDNEQIIHFGYGGPEGCRAAPEGAIYMDLLEMGHSKI